MACWPMIGVTSGVSMTRLARVSALAFALVFSATPATGAAPALTPNAPPLAVRKIRGGIYEVTGGAINNTGFYVGAREVLCIDAKMTPEATREMVAEIKKLTPNPITFVALTHSDTDHVGGLTGYPQSVRVIAQANARRDLDQAFTDAAQRAYLPTLAFTDELDLHAGDATVRLLYFGPAHTNGDVVVYFPAEKLAFVGDLVFLGRDPLIHREKKGGTSVGLVKVLRSILQLDADTFLNGHAQAATRADVQALIAKIEDTQAKVKALVAKHKTVAEVKVALKAEDQPVPPGGHRWPSLVEVVYAELTEKK
jgi:glyoxylase-like metal-dependent hydrolase (beta-lactamase superfamily II)